MLIMIHYILNISFYALNTVGFLIVICISNELRQLIHRCTKQIRLCKWNFQFELYRCMWVKHVSVTTTNFYTSTFGRAVKVIMKVIYFCKPQQKGCNVCDNILLIYIHQIVAV